MTKDIITWFFKSVGYFLLGIPVLLLGPIIVYIALKSKIDRPETTKPFSQYPGNWMMVNLPAWAKWWDNTFDGAMGDKRGWWNNYCLEHYKKDAYAFRSMWQWLAIRNPCNYYSRVVTGIDVSQCDIAKLAGDDVVHEKEGMREWNFLVATRRSDGKKFHRLYCVFPFSFDPTHAVMIDIGWKIVLGHRDVAPDAPEKDRIKGSVFSFSPWKSI